MPAILSALAAGLLFGLGLTVSGMVDPAKVLGFLDIAGDWDPTLAFVMGGALMVTLVAFRFVPRARHPAFAQRFELPTRRDIDARLVTGAVLFGVGWGLVGLCPGPALSALAIEPGRAAIFVAAMIAGMMLFRLLPQPGQASPKTPASGKASAVS